jgi:hypothetical protein
MLELAEGLAGTDASADLSHARAAGLTASRSRTTAPLRARRRLSR